ncbi:MAG TPA: hypothetical protein VJ579_04990 [Candidatus Paceibacterota bacterium]|nr:hypothetical protein [Candidatus Paceibacterota bacterium]
MSNIFASAWFPNLLALASIVIGVAVARKIARNQKERELALELRCVILRYFNVVGLQLTDSEAHREARTAFAKLIKESLEYVNSATTSRTKSWGALHRDFNRILLDLVRVSKLANGGSTV